MQQTSASGHSSPADAVDRLASVACGCERVDLLDAMSPTREDLVRLLLRHGFGCPGSAVPTDWPTYYDVDELKGFVLELAEADSPSY